MHGAPGMLTAPSPACGGGLGWGLLARNRRGLFSPRAKQKGEPQGPPFFSRPVSRRSVPGRREGRPGLENYFFFLAFDFLAFFAVLAFFAFLAIASSYVG